MAISKKIADIKSRGAGGCMVSSSQSLCLQCGLCCDGTIFSTVQLKPHDELAPLKAAGANIFWENGANVFKLPCAAYQKCTCTVYANRPQDCREYKCQLLKRFERDEITEAAALEIIKKALSLKDELNALALAASTSIQSKEGLSITNKMLSIKREVETSALAGSAQSKNKALLMKKKDYAQLFLKFGVLQVYVDKFFRNRLGQATAPRTDDSASLSNSSKS
jgi:hypothetical protein